MKNYELIKKLLTIFAFVSWLIMAIVLSGSTCSAQKKDTVYTVINDSMYPTEVLIIKVIGSDTVSISSFSSLSSVDSSTHFIRHRKETPKKPDGNED